MNHLVIRLVAAGIAAIVIAALAVYVATHPATFFPAGPLVSGAADTPAPAATSPAAGSTAPVWLTAPSQQAFSGAVPPAPRLAAIRPQSQAGPGYDRISFDFKQAAAPGYQISYVNQVVQDGSGAEVALTGPFYLQLVFSPSTSSGLSTAPATPGYTGLRSYILNGNAEGQVSVALGVAAGSGYRISQVPGGDGVWTIQVDIRHP
jgi:hypothetical protein